VSHAPEPVVTVYRIRQRDGLPPRERRAQPERAVRPGRVVVPHELVQNPLEVPWPQEQQPVQAVAAHRAHPARRERVREGCPHRRAHHSDALARNTRSNDGANFAPRSRKSSVGHTPASRSCQQTFRACWVTQAAVGCAVQPARSWRRIWASFFTL
jgi:hypothetical protein